MDRSVPRRDFLATGGASAAAALGFQPGRLGKPPAQPAPPLKYQLGIVTYNIAAAWDVATILRICQSVGLAAVELRTTHRHGVEPTLAVSQRQEIRSRFQDAGVMLWGLGTTCEFQSPEQREVEKQIEICKQFVRLAADLGARGVKVRPNGLPREVPVAKTLEQIGKSLILCGKAAADHNVEIWVEVHGSGTAQPLQMKTIMDHCGHGSVGICWNSNPTDVTQGSILPALDLLWPWIKSCHINELHTNYPWRELFTQLRVRGYDRVTLAEIPGMPDPASGERLLRYYKALWTAWTH
jgi:sugar phosphate isomerase/epimerase